MCITVNNLNTQRLLLVKPNSAVYLKAFHLQIHWVWVGWCTLCLTQWQLFSMKKNHVNWTVHLMTSVQMLQSAVVIKFPPFTYFNKQEGFLYVLLQAHQLVAVTVEAAALNIWLRVTFMLSLRSHCINIFHWWKTRKDTQLKTNTIK